MDTPWAVVRPETDQMPGACKNWFSVGRWIDISNDKYGVTVAILDAPLVEVGSLTGNLLGSQTDPKAWIEHLDFTKTSQQTFYSWVMNNHWHTNYRAEQEGPTVFRYAIRPHKGPFDPVAAQRFGIEQSQPLVAVPCKADAPAVTPSRLTLDTPDVIVTALKPSRDGKALIVRLFGAAGRDAKANIAWGQPQPKSVSTCNVIEEPLQAVSGPIEVPRYGIVTLRAEM